MNELLHNHSSVFPFSETNNSNNFPTYKSIESFYEHPMLPPPFNFIRRKTLEHITLSELSQTIEKNHIVVIFPAFVINPLGKFRKVWNFLILLSLLYTLWIYPVRISFFVVFLDWNDSKIYFDLIVDILFLTDVFLNFFTALENKQGKLIYRHADICMNYLKGWFLLDLISSIPFYMVIRDDLDELNDMDRSTPFTVLLPAQFKLICMLRILKIFRFYSNSRQIEHFCFKKLKMNHHVYLILKFLGLIIFTVHISGCLWFFLCSLENDENSWIFVNGLNISPFDNIYYQYISSVYFVVTILISVGYGGTMIPTTNFEKIIFVSIVFFALGMFGYIMGTFITLFSNKISYMAQVFVKLQQYLDDFTVKFRVSKILHWKMLFSFQKSCFFNYNILESYEKKFLNLLPLSLHYEILTFIYCDLFKHFEFLIDKPMSFITQLLPSLKPVYYSIGDEVYKQGDPASCIYFVQKGRVVTCCEDDNGVERAQIYSEGTYFGEVDIILHQERLENCYAETELKLLRISKYNFLSLLDHFDEIKNEVIKNAKKRSEIRNLYRKSTNSNAALLPKSYWIWRKNKECFECSIEDAHLSQRRSVIRKSILDGTNSRREFSATSLSSKSSKWLNRKATLAKIAKFVGKGIDPEVEIEDGEIDKIAKEKLAGIMKEELGFCKTRSEILRIFEIIDENEQIQEKRKKLKNWGSKEELDKIFETTIEVSDILKEYLDSG